MSGSAIWWKRAAINSEEQSFSISAHSQVKAPCYMDFISIAARLRISATIFVT